MNYGAYETAIRQQHHIQITGWPEGVEFASPSDISSTQALRALRDALRCGACHWTIMSKRDIQEMNAEVEKQRVNGDVAAKARKPRKDKGTKRPREDDGGGGSENNHPAKQKKVTKSKPKNKGTTSKKAGKGKVKGKVTDMLLPKSKEFVDDSDGDSNNGEQEDAGDKESG